MATEVTVSSDVKCFIQDIIAKSKLNPESHVTYNVGSEVGDGYLSRTIAVDIDDEEEHVHLFLKCALNIKSPGFMDVNKIYSNEIYFYDVIYPRYVKFCKERGVEDGLPNVPKCYGTSSKNIVALENLRKRDFTLFDRKKMMNDNHITLIFKAYAKYHAISMAYKDQKREEYEAIAENALQIMGDPEMQNSIEESQTQIVNECRAKWDPVEDKYILSQTENLDNDLVRQMNASGNLKDEYSVITKGDCWSNNMMFQYKADDKENPSDVMLLDWQLIHEGSLVLDLSYFFYTVASKEALSKLNQYLKLYHEELSNHIRLLGSDPDAIYPYSALKKEWKKHCAYGYSMAFIILKVMLIAKDDVPNLEEMDFENIDMKKVFNLKDDREYVKRIKVLTEHMVENNFLKFD